MLKSTGRPRRSGRREGLVAPGIPVHRIVGVLQQIRTAFEKKTVRKFRRTVIVEMAGARLILRIALHPGLLDGPGEWLGRKPRRPAEGQSRQAFLLARLRKAAVTSGQQKRDGEQHRAAELASGRASRG